MCARNADPPPQDEGLPPWMATFADMVTLLLCFFVLMLSFAQEDLDKFRAALGSLQDAFGVRVERKAADELAMAPMKLATQAKDMAYADKVLLGVILRLRTFLDEDPVTRDAAGVKAARDGALVTVQSGVMFDPGTARIRPEGRRILNKVVAILKDHNYDLVVRGHTAGAEGAGTLYPSAWELSAARAARALEYIVASGISAKRAKAVGYADTRPVARTGTPGADASNRRIEFYLHLAETDAW